MAEILACCLTPSSCYLNQCWLEIFYNHPSTISKKMHKKSIIINNHLFIFEYLRPSARASWIKNLPIFMRLIYPLSPLLFHWQRGKCNNHHVPIISSSPHFCINCKSREIMLFHHICLISSHCFYSYLSWKHDSRERFLVSIIWNCWFLLRKLHWLFRITRDLS